MSTATIGSKFPELKNLTATVTEKVIGIITFTGKAAKIKYNNKTYKFDQQEMLRGRITDLMQGEEVEFIPIELGDINRAQDVLPLSKKKKQTNTKVIGEVTYVGIVHACVDFNGIDYNFSQNNMAKGRLTDLKQGDQVEFIPAEVDGNMLARLVQALQTEEIDTDEVLTSSIISIKDGFGFIKYPPNNLFFHYTETTNFYALSVGDLVNFKLGKNPTTNETIAVQVTKVSPNTNVDKGVVELTTHTSEVVIIPEGCFKSFFIEPSESWGEVNAITADGVWTHHKGFKKDQNKESVNRLLYHPFKQREKSTLEKFTAKTKAVHIQFTPTKIKVYGEMLLCLSDEGALKLLSLQSDAIEGEITISHSKSIEEFIIYSLHNKQYLLVGINLKEPTEHKSGEVWIYEIVTASSVELIPLQVLSEIPGNARSKPEVSASGWMYGKEITTETDYIVVGSGKEKSTSTSKSIGVAYKYRFENLLKNDFNSEKVSYNSMLLQHLNAQVIELNGEPKSVKVTEDTDLKGLHHMSLETL